MTKPFLFLPRFGMETGRRSVAEPNPSRGGLCQRDWESPEPDSISARSNLVAVGLKSHFLALYLFIFSTLYADFVKLQNSMKQKYYKWRYVDSNSTNL